MASAWLARAGLVVLASTNECRLVVVVCPNAPTTHHHSLVSLTFICIGDSQLSYMKPSVNGGNFYCPALIVMNADWSNALITVSSSHHPRVSHQERIIVIVGPSLSLLPEAFNQVENVSY